MSPGLVRAALHTAAATHRPDRAAILARIESGQAAHRRSRTPRFIRRRTAVRTAGIAATMAAVFGLGAAATWAAVGDGATREPHPAASAMMPAATSGSADPAPGHVSTGHSPSTARPSHSPAASPASTGSQQRVLTSSGAVDPHSIDNWAQSNVTLTNSQTVTALEVRVRIALTPSVASTGAWSSVPAEDLVMTVEQQPGALVYRFTLKAEVQLAPGSYVFAVQYNHATGGRDASRDSYQAIATLGGSRVEVAGGF